MISDFEAKLSQAEYAKQIGNWQLEIGNLLDFLVLRVDIFVRQSDPVVFRLKLFRNQQIIFGLEEICAAVNRQLKIVTVSDGVLRAGLDTITAEDAAPVIDVVNGRIAFVHTYALFGRPRIVGGNDVNTFRRTRGGAEVTGNALFAPELVDVQEVLPAITRLHRHRLVRILHRPLAL